MKQNNGSVYIGLTGGIGSGKTEASKILSGLGAYIIDTDIIAREVVKSGSDGARRIEEEFGKEFFDNGVLNRRRLREYVFGSADRTGKLNLIMHDLIREEMCEEMLNAESRVVVSVVPLLFEADWRSLFDEVWLICAFSETRINRVTNRDNIDRENTLSIIKTQMSDAYKKRMADVVINNNGTIKVLKKNLEIQYNRVFKG